MSSAPYVHRPDQPAWGPVLARAAASGAAALVDPARLSTERRRWLFTGIGALAAWQWWEEAVRPENDPMGLGLGTPAARVTGAAALVSVMPLLAGPATRLDNMLMNALRRRGVRRPRLAVAAVTVAVSIAGERWRPAPEGTGEWFTYDADGRRITMDDFPPGSPEALGWDGEDPVWGELHPRTREVVAGILGLLDGWGAEELRAQLARAEEEQHTVELSWRGLRAEAGPRTAVSDFIVPAHATAQVDGETLHLGVQVLDGRLASVFTSSEQPLDWDRVESLAFVPHEPPMPAD